MPKSFPSPPRGGEQPTTSVTVVPLLYSNSLPVVQIQNSSNTPHTHTHLHQQEQLLSVQSQTHHSESDHLYNSIHHKDELDAAEALANLAFNCRQRMMGSCVNGGRGMTFQRPLNAISS